ncbi:MAG: thiamine pyrophosphate-dependent enzyme [Phycisphaerae bacterium]
MNLNRAQVIDENLVRFLRERIDADPEARVGAELDAPIRAGHALTGRETLDLFHSQMICRHLDLIARELRGRDQGFYTIGSAGHEGNAVVGRLTRYTDPALLHYRSGAFMVQRAKQLPGSTPVWDTLLSQVASAEDPIAGGRHKVWGSKPLWVLPQTSTIASHLPKSVGTAFAIERARRGGVTLPVPADSIVVCSFGDASCNHGVAAAAFNTTSWIRHQNLPLPILFVCEDNGIGISVHTPPGWVETMARARPHFEYFTADALDLVEAHSVVAEAVACCRSRRQPVFLHLRCVRLLGHAGSDIETEYHTLAEIAAVEAHDPLLRSAALLLDAGVITARQLLDSYESIRRRVRAVSEEAVRRPKQTRVAEIVAAGAPCMPTPCSARRPEQPDAEARLAAFGGTEKLPDAGRPRHLKVLLNWALHDAMVKYPQLVLFGEDVARKGGVYNVTTGLTETFGLARCFNTLLDETTILGLAIGLGQMGFLPMPEIQYLAYYHNAEDQLRGEACSLQYFSQDQFRNPMVVRIAGMAYQKGFGGHFHNDNSVAALRDIPGLVIGLPSRGDDAVGMLRTMLALAAVDGRVSALIEPIALYMTKDLYDAGDGLWQYAYPSFDATVPLGAGRTYFADAPDLTLLTYGNGVYLSLRAAKTLEREHGLRCRVSDIRWLNPLPVDFIEAEARATGRVLVVDECRRTGGMAEPIVTALLERCGSDVSVARLCAEDVYIPLGKAANVVLVSESGIVEAARQLAGNTARRDVPNGPPHALPRGRAPAGAGM